MENTVDKTPLNIFKKRHLIGKNAVTPLKIPASPLLEKLGLGTGIEIVKISRSPRNNQIRSPWAIKRISKKCAAFNKQQGGVYSKRLIAEAEILKKLKHPNIIGFRALQHLNDGRDCMAMELCNISLGNLLEKRLEDEMGSLPIGHIIKIGQDISKALDYLHNEALILHGDMKSHNILIKNNFEICKLCDFGVSLSLKKDGHLDLEKDPLQQYVGTELWTAPEVLEGESELITTKSEIFSFGLVLYETIALYPPHTAELQAKKCLDFDDTMEEDEDEDDEIDLNELIGTRPIFPGDLKLDSTYDEILQVFFLCTKDDPLDRPSARILSEIFSAMK